MDDKAFGVYISIFGFVLIFIGILVAYLSVNTVQSGDLSLSGSSMMLLIGVMAGVVGAVLLLMGFFKPQRRSYLYY